MTLFIAIVLAVIGGGILYEDSRSNHPDAVMQLMGCACSLVSVLLVSVFIWEVFK